MISDTHGLLRTEALKALRGSEHIIHAGDIGNPDVISGLGTVAPVTAIKGNVDRQQWAEGYAATRTISLGGRRIHIVHDLKALDIDPADAGIDVVISGHSHRPAIETKGGVLYLNPGSAGARRFRLPIAVATVEIDAERIQARIHELPV